MPSTPRDRLRTALAHREPDRPPFDLGSTQVTSIASRPQRRLRARLGLPGMPGRVSDRVQQLDHVEEDLLRVLEVDTRGLWPLTARNAPVEEMDDGEHLSHVDEWGIVYCIPREGGLWYDLASSPLARGELTRDRIDAHPWPRGDDPGNLFYGSRSSVVSPAPRRGRRSSWGAPCPTAWPRPSWPCSSVIWGG